MPLPALDPWQYRLVSEEIEGARRFGTFSLEVGADINCAAVFDSKGRPVGWLIGFAMDLVGRSMVTDRLDLDLSYGANREGFAEAVIRSLAGRFLWMADLDGALRLYPDTSALVPCVFDAVAGHAGSTAHALLNDGDYEARFQTDAFARYGIERDGWFPAGLTAHRGIERLLPNHYLDLQTWTCTRHWPKAPLQPVSDPDAAVGELIQVIRTQLEILAGDSKPAALTLTAGRDTRILLACAQPFASQMRFATVIGEDSHSCDSVMARMIAAQYSLNFTELPRKRATQEAHDRYMRRGAHCVGDANAWYFPSISPLAPDHVLVGGAGGETGRAFFWRSGDRADSEISGAALAGRMGFAQHPELVDRLDHWLSGTGQTNMLAILDLAYIEQRMGPWGAAQFCNDPTLVRIAPMVCRQSIEILIGLPDDWKRTERLAEEVMRQAWPELSHYKFNSLGRVRDTWAKAQKAFRDPRAVVRKLRKLASR